MCPYPRGRFGLLALSWILFISLFSSASIEAQVCQSDLDLGFTNISGNFNASVNCVGLFRCYNPTVSEVQYRIRPVDCDPAIETCTIRAVVPLQFRGNHSNTTGSGFFDSPVKLLWTDSDGDFAGACGNAGARIQVDRGEAWIQRSFTCGDAGDTYNLRITVCDDVSNCEKVANKSVDLTTPTISAAVCPPPPEKNDCDDCSCESTGGGGPGTGAAPPFGGGASSGGAGTGPGAVWFYKAGGIGRPMQPGSNQWNHGRFWSHSYGQRIFQDTDPDIVHLITERAVYRTYTDTNSDGNYDEVDPGSEYRTLEETVFGWTLTDLAGTVTEFELNGRWLATTDRYGNSKTAAYSGSDLMSVTMPDGRREEFTYLNGKVRTITEVGVDGSTSRSWTYTWAGDDLTRIDRPDGTALEYLYGDASHPGYLTRITLIGMPSTASAIAFWKSMNVGPLLSNRAVFGSSTHRLPTPTPPAATSIKSPLAPAAKKASPSTHTTATATCRTSGTPTIRASAKPSRRPQNMLTIHWIV